MRCSIALLLAALLPLQAGAQQPTRTQASPLLEFIAQPAQPGVDGPFASRGASAVPPERAKKPFEMVITTPTTAFPHMRSGGSNALLECIVPGMLKRDPQ